MMKRKLILTGAALSLAVAMTGCGGNAVTNQQASSQAQLISMETAQEVALKAANIAAENAEYCRVFSLMRMREKFCQIFWNVCSI